MMMSRRVLLTLLVLAAPLPVASAHAASTGANASQKLWATMDQCTKKATEKFPDHTAEELAKRDVFIRQCQRDSRVPVREGLAPKG